MLELAAALAVMHRQHPTATRQMSLYTWMCLAMPVVLPPAKLQYVGGSDAKGVRFHMLGVRVRYILTIAAGKQLQLCRPV